jgi:hypothetical protein
LQTYESSLSGILEKLRPFTTQQNAALRTQKSHYLSLLEDERSANLELRLEIARMQEGMSRVLTFARTALEQHEDGTRPYRKRIAALRAENEVLARICGVQPLDVDEEIDDDDQDGSSGDDEGSGSKGIMSAAFALDEHK